MTRTRTWPGSLCVLAGMLAALAPTGAIFSDTGWLAPAVAVVALVVLVGAVFRLLPGPGRTGWAIAAELAVMLLALPYLCTPDALAGGIWPGPNSYAAVLSSVHEGFSQVFATNVPVATTSGFLTLVVIGVGLLSILVDTTALDLGQEKVAAVVALSALALPALLAGGEVGRVSIACSCAGFVLVLLSRAALAVPPRLPTAAVAAGIIAVVAAVALPSVLPDVPDTHRTRLGTGDLKVANPFLDLHKDLADRTDDPLLEYTTDEKSPDPIRLTAVSSFDGRIWQPEDFTLNARNSVARGLPAAQEVRNGKTRESTTKITVRDLTGSYLPAPYAPRRVTGAGDGWIYDPKTLTMVSHDGLVADSSYTVDSVAGAPTAAQLRSAPAADRAQFARELELPGSLPASVHATAQRVTRGADSAWERAAKIQAYLRSDRFTYSLDAPDTASSSAIADFLRERRGYCVQFSATMAVMARTLGIPARIAVGYTPGTQGANDAYTVTGRDAHAWPELYFPGYGWTRFEPTPGGTAGSPPSWTGAEEPKSGDRPSSAATPSEAAAAPSDDPSEGGQDTSAAASPTPEQGQEQGGGGDTGSAIPRWLWWTAAAVLALALLLSSPAAVRRLQAARRLDSADPLAQWRELTALLIDYGSAPDAGDTVQATARALADASDGDERVAGLARAVDSVRYGPAGSVPGLPKSEAREAAAAVRAGLSRDARTGRRLLAVWFPASLVRGRTR